MSSESKGSDTETFNSFITKWGGLLAILGGTLGVILTPFMVSIWNYEGGIVPWADKWIFYRIFGPILEEAGALTFAPAHIVYYTYGRLYFLVYLLILPGVISFHRALPQHVKDHGNLPERYKLLILGLLVAMIGDIGGYWGNSEPGFNLIQAGGAYVEIVGLLMILGASLIYGRGLNKAGAIPRWPAWLLILSAPAGILVHLMIFYFPNGPMFFFCLTWVAIGYKTWSEKRKVSFSATAL